MAKTKKKSKVGRIIGVSIVLVLAVLIAFPMLSANTASAYSEITAKKGNIETYYTFSGNVESKNTQNVLADKIMQISEIEVKEGQKVKKDSVLFKTTQGEEIKAKVAGTVSAIHVEEDDAVMTGSPLCEIIDFDHLQITIKVDEYDLSSVSIGKNVSVSIGAIEKEISGKISDISDTATNQNGVAYFTATVDLKKDYAIKVGMTTEAKILNKSIKDALTIPMNVLQFDDEEKPFILIKSDENKPVEKYLTLGINDGKNVEVKDGLSIDQTILYKKEASSSSSSSNSFMPPVPGRQS